MSVRENISVIKKKATSLLNFLPNIILELLLPLISNRVYHFLDMLLCYPYFTDRTFPFRSSILRCCLSLKLNVLKLCRAMLSEMLYICINSWEHRCLLLNYDRCVSNTERSHSSSFTYYCMSECCDLQSLCALSIKSSIL